VFNGTFSTNRLYLTVEKYMYIVQGQETRQTHLIKQYTKLTKSQALFDLGFVEIISLRKE